MSLIARRVFLLLATSKQVEVVGMRIVIAFSPFLSLLPASGGSKCLDPSLLGMFIFLAYFSHFRNAYLMPPTP